MEDSGPLAVIGGLILAVIVAYFMSQTGLDSANIQSATTVAVVSVSENDAQTSTKITGTLNAAPTDSLIWVAYLSPAGDYTLAKTLPATAGNDVSIHDFVVPQPASMKGSEIVFLVADTDNNLTWGGSVRAADGMLPLGKQLPPGSHRTHVTSTQALRA